MTQMASATVHTAGDGTGSECACGPVVAQTGGQSGRYVNTCTHKCLVVPYLLPSCCPQPGDIIGCAADLDNKTFMYSINGSFEHPMGIPPYSQHVNIVGGLSPAFSIDVCL